MAVSLVELFIETPSVDLFNQCRKVDLYSIADHFAIPVPRTVVKAELKRVLLTGLVDKQIFSLVSSSSSVESIAGDALVVDKTEESGLVGSTDATAEPIAVQTNGDTAVRPKTPFSMPRYEPLSLSSDRPSQDARLKARLARLQLEREDRVLSRQLEKELAVS